MSLLPSLYLGANCKPFRLFEDIEQKAGNEEYLKEKKKKEELAKKKEGSLFIDCLKHHVFYILQTK